MLYIIIFNIINKVPNLLTSIIDKNQIKYDIILDKNNCIISVMGKPIKCQKLKQIIIILNIIKII